MQSTQKVQERAFVIYLCGPSPEGKFYVGQTSDFQRRVRDHQAKKGGCPKFHLAIAQFGWECLQPRIVAQTDIQEDADRLERLYITKFNSLFPSGYNLTLGGRGTLFDPKAKSKLLKIKRPVWSMKMGKRSPLNWWAADTRADRGPAGADRAASAGGIAEFAGVLLGD